MASRTAARKSSRRSLRHKARGQAEEWRAAPAGGRRGRKDRWRAAQLRAQIVEIREGIVRRGRGLAGVALPQDGAGFGENL